MKNRAEAVALGRKAGREEAEEVYNTQGADDLRDCMLPGHLRWDEGARNAHAHALDGIGTFHKEAYYAAYNEGADERARELLTDKT